MGMATLFKPHHHPYQKYLIFGKKITSKTMITNSGQTISSSCHGKVVSLYTGKSKKAFPSSLPCLNYAVVFFLSSFYRGLGQGEEAVCHELHQ